VGELQEEVAELSARLVVLQVRGVNEGALK
jgi:hypothetical protein